MLKVWSKVNMQTDLPSIPNMNIKDVADVIPQGNKNQLFWINSMFDDEQIKQGARASADHKVLHQFTWYIPGSAQTRCTVIETSPWRVKFPEDQFPPAVMTPDTFTHWRKGMWTDIGYPMMTPASHFGHRSWIYECTFSALDTLCQRSFSVCSQPMRDSVTNVTSSLIGCEHTENDPCQSRMHSI